MIQHFMFKITYSIHSIDNQYYFKKRKRLLQNFEISQNQKRRMNKEGFSNELIIAIDEIIHDTKWQNIGKVDELSRKNSFLLYPNLKDGDGDESELVQVDDIVVFCVGHRQFYAIDCACPHEGK